MNTATMSSLTIEYWGEQLQSAGHGKKSQIREQACNALGLSKDAFYRALKKAGFSSGKQRRSDAGTTALTDDTVNMLVAILNQGVRENGKRVMNVTTARSMLIANGYECLSHSQICRVLAQRNASVNDLDRATPHVQLRSLGPNHVHQTDPSYCLLYYPPGKPGKRQTFMNDADFYANKPDNLEKVKNFRVWRYVLVDHYSGAIRLFYFEAAGETQANMFEFLMWCWQQHDSSPIHGVPQVLMWDKGSANGAKAIKNVLKALNVKNIPHEAGNPRAKGAVEKANDIVETQFESRILFEPVDSVAELNAAAWAWQEAFNANVVPGMNCRHHRHKQPRLDVWKHIYKAENRQFLRALPDLQICRLLLTKQDETRKVAGDLTISYRHPVAKKSIEYDLSDLANIRNGMKVTVGPVIVNDCHAILVGVSNEFNEAIYHQVEPVNTDESGFRLDAPVIGEKIARHSDTAAQASGKAADKLAFGEDATESEIKRAKKTKAAPFNGALNAHSHLKDIKHETHLAPQGEVITPDSAITAQVTDAAKRKGNVLESLDLRILLANRLGRNLRPMELDYIAGLGDVVDTQVNDIVEELHRGVSHAPVLKIAR
ncbi:MULTISPECIES: hypothetical protein [unclassified Pseudoalteromonas]|nr:MULTISPECIES: hypothetical protein [unclassified Pseudoalteromonas]